MESAIVKRGQKADRAAEAVPVPVTFSEETAARKLDISVRQLQRYRKQNLISYFRCGWRVLYDDECLHAFKAKFRRSAAA